MNIHEMCLIKGWLACFCTCMVGEGRRIQRLFLLRATVSPQQSCRISKMISGVAIEKAQGLGNLRASYDFVIL